MEDFARALKQKFNLDIKPSSKEIMVCSGLDFGCVGNEWKQVEVLNMLGHFVSHNSGCTHDWWRVKPVMWAVFWKNSGSVQMHDFNFETKLSLLMRTVFCVVNWKFSRWPFSKTIAVEMDSMQVNMVSILSRLPKLDSEDWAWERF